MAPAAPALAAAGEDEPEGRIDIVQIEGHIDPVVADLITGALAGAAGATAVILQIDSQGALGTDPARVVDAVREADVPVVVWVGPGRSRVAGAAAAVALAADVVVISPAASIGPLDPVRLDKPNYELPDMQARPALDKRLGARALVDAELVDFLAPTIGDVVIGLDGLKVDGTKLSTARVVETDDGPRQTAKQRVRFIKLDTFGGVTHSLASPALTYLFLVVGLGLLVFEFYTAAIGLASATGAACLAGAAIGFSHLPGVWWAIALIVVSALGFAVDVQAGRPRFWTGVGVIALVVGSLSLFDGTSALDVPLWLVVVGVVGQGLFNLSGMTVAIRNRFSIASVGRDAMIGELGEARTVLSPDGVVTVRGAPWRAHTLRGNTVTAGRPVRVVAVKQLVLEVEAAADPL